MMGKSKRASAAQRTGGGWKPERAPVKLPPGAARWTARKRSRPGRAARVTAPGYRRLWGLLYPWGRPREGAVNW